ncbi:hypothetical protein TNCV_2254201 [Trichonephila clavipes]|nr:hypothetical protein TNCV_2254201 [Trichonephila clavipes]
MGVNSHLPIHNRFYSFSHQLVKDKNDTHRLSLDFMTNQLGSDQCTWPWGHCLCLNSGSEVRQTGRHNSEVEPSRRSIDNRRSLFKIIMSSF